MSVRDTILEPHDTPIAQSLFDTRDLSSALAAPLSDEDQVVQAIDDTSPTKWHLAHTTWFFEAFIIGTYLKGYERFHDKFEYCFNSYYEAVGPRHPRPKRGLLTRPSAQDVRDYRNYVDDALRNLFVQYDGELPDELEGLIKLGINHEQQHQELLLTDILYLFSVSPLYPAYKKAVPVAVLDDAVGQDWLSFEGGMIDIGHEGCSFAYDNEGPRHQQFVRPFQLSNRLVTNREWLEFINDGGYQNHTLWFSDGWARVQSEAWDAPLHWRQIDGHWHQVSLEGLHPVDPLSPVSHVSYYEADAFARWSGKRLPSEFEWEHAAGDLSEAGNMLDLGVLKPLPAKSGDGLLQMFGEVWEWMHSPYMPYPGFEAAEGAVGEYNGKFMCNQFVLRGGSCATPPGHIRKTYRNFFYPFQRWQFMGVRLAADI